MKRTIVQIIFFIYCIANVYPQYSTIWQLGKTDNSSKEFALAPDGKDRFIISGFGDNKKYYDLYSLQTKHPELTKYCVENKLQLQRKLLKLKELLENAY